MRMDRIEDAVPYRTIAIVCFAHFLSHFYILLLPPVFLLMSPHFGVGFTELGIALTVFSVATTLSQPTVGRLVDRMGAREILIAGLVLEGASFTLVGLTGSYTSLLLLMAVAGLANSAYHPADYAILGRLVSRENIGKAFSLHTFSGFLGGAMAPMAMTAAATTWSWQAGVVAAGLVGIAASVPVLLIPRMPVLVEKASGLAAPDRKAGLSGQIVLLTLFFFFVALSTSGIQSFSVVVLTDGWNVSLGEASIALTVFLATMAFGVLGGGLLADRFRNHEAIAAICFCLAGIVTLSLAVVKLDPIAITAIFGLAGLLVGVVMPSRDMMVHKAATPGTTGYVFGIVTTGLNVGGIIAPPVFGYLVDHRMYAAVFVLSACAMILTSGVVLLQRHSATAPQKETA
jgi:MFS family permease